MSYYELIQQHEQNPDRLLNRKEAAEMLRLKPQTLAAWACLGRHDLPVVKIGSRAMYRLGDVRRAMKSQGIALTL